MKNEEFEPLMRQLCASFNRTASVDVLLAYWLVFQNCDESSFRAGITRAITESRFMPVPSELLEFCGRRTVQERAILAYTSAVEAVSGLGPYKHVDFEDRALNAVIRSLGGWPTFCARFDHGPDEEKWTRKEFIETYRAIAGRAIGDEQGRPLCGLSECDVRRGQLVKPIPLLLECDSADEHDAGRESVTALIPYDHSQALPKGPVRIGELLDRPR